MQSNNPEPILPPVARELLRAELTPERKVRDTHRAGNEIYVFAAAECPALMREVGRLREVAFRGARAVRWISTRRTWLRTATIS